MQGKDKDLLFFLTEQYHFSVVEFDSEKGAWCSPHNHIPTGSHQSHAPIHKYQTLLCKGSTKLK